jgi:glycosyltransferase involved in cell wall biosynthesis
MVVVHLLASPFFGGIERQLLGLAQNLPPDYRTVFLSFAERGLARPFLENARLQGFEAIALEHNAPHFHRAAREVAGHLRRVGAGVLCCSGYKPDVIGWRAARLAGIPVVSISHGWTAATLKVRLYEALDRLILHAMDCTVCVSKCQAVRVRRSLVSAGRVVVIRNAIETEPFNHPDPAYRRTLEGLFSEPPRWIVGAAGRLSPEKGFGQLVQAAEIVLRSMSDVGFVLFGDGPLRQALAKEIAARDLANRFVLAGFRSDLEKCLPQLDLFTLPSYTEGLPVVVLEAFAARVPVVATAVGGTPEVVEEGVTGYLVPAGDADTLARRVLDLLRDEEKRRAMGRRGRQQVEKHFTFAAQSAQYQQLFERLTHKNGRFVDGIDQLESHAANGEPPSACAAGKC